MCGIFNSIICVCFHNKQSTLDITEILLNNLMSSSISGSFMKINSHFLKQKAEENADPWTYPEVDFLNISLKSACFKDNCLRLLKVEWNKDLVNCDFIRVGSKFPKHTLKIF